MTVRTLVLLRHAKAMSPENYADDFERPLSPRGLADAAAAGRWFVAQGVSPQLVLCSPALRTRQTWEAVGSSVGDVLVAYEPRLYLTSPTDALELVQGTDPRVETLVVVGHNPTLSVLSAMLDTDELTGEGLHTAGIAVHRLPDGDWHDFDAHTAPVTLEHTARG